MAKNTSETRGRTRRTEVKELPKPARELSKDEQKQITGGANRIVGGGIRGSGGDPPPPPPVCGV